MLDDAFKLTIDKIFPPLVNKPQDNKDTEQYKVNGFPNDENMWYGCLI